MKLRRILKENMNAYKQAAAEIEGGPDREQRRDRSRMSDQQLVRQRAEEIEKNTEELKNSSDPVDRQLLVKRRQLAKLQDEIAQLQKKKEARS